MRDRSRATVRVEFTKRARRKLADVRELTLRVQATATYPDGITADLGTKRTTLRR